MKIALATFFLLLFSFQILPVSDIGKLLFEQQLTEEISDCDCDGEAENSEVKENDIFNNSPFNSLVFRKAKQANSFSLSAADHIKKQHIADITTPPPNVL